MGDNVEDPLEDTDSENEGLEKPPTPKIHHGDSPGAPGFSDISDNEQEETPVDEAPTKHPEDSKESLSVNSSDTMGKIEKENTSKKRKDHHLQDSPLYDQEISPVSSTAEGVERDENNSEKTEKEASFTEKESDSVASNTLTEITSKSVDNTQESSEHNVEGKHEPSGFTEKSNICEPEGRTDEKSNDPEGTNERRRTISSGAVTDDDLEMPISPLGLGFSGTESDIVDDILKSDVSNLLPDIRQETKERIPGILYDDIMIFGGCA